MRTDSSSRTVWNPWALFDFALAVAALYVLIAARSKTIDLCCVATGLIVRLVASYWTVKHWKKTEAILHERRERDGSL